MAGARKHGAHRNNLNAFLTTAAGPAQLEGWTYDAFATLGSGTASAPSLNYDLTSEALVEATLFLGTTLVGQATNFTGFRLTHYSAAGAVKNQIRVDYNAAGVTSVAFTPINLAVAGGAVVTGAGTGVLTVPTGTALPWTLLPGDTIVLDALVTGTGQYTGAFGVTFMVQAKGA